MPRSTSWYAAGEQLPEILNEDLASIADRNQTILNLENKIAEIKAEAERYKAEAEAERARAEAEAERAKAEKLRAEQEAAARLPVVACTTIAGHCWKKA